MSRSNLILHHLHFAYHKYTSMTTFFVTCLQDNLLASHLTSRDLSAMDLDTACFIHHDAYVLNLNPFSGSNLSTARMSPNVPSNKERFKDMHLASQSIWTSEELSFYQLGSVDYKTSNYNAILIQFGLIHIRIGFRMEVL
jgi:hypothetical protein